MTRRLALALAALCLSTPILARADEPFPDGEKAFAHARELIKQYYVDDKLTDDRLWQNATGGLLGGLGEGKWNQLMSPGEWKGLQADFGGEIVGIGVEIDFDAPSGMVVVEGVVVGSAAEKAGLRIGDRILRIDDKSLKGLDVLGVAKLIRGKRGSTVTLSVLRDAQMITRTLQRQPLSLAPVNLLPLAGNIALIELRSFDEKTPALLAAALQKARASSAKSLIIDLRDNKGGLFDKMIDCAAELLPRNSLVVTAIGRGGKVEEQHTAQEPLARLPMVALINGESASGAEILAAALKTSGGARLIGTKTFGKWSVQRVEELGNGWALKMTTARLRSASGQMLDGKGLEPDLQVDMKEHVSRERDADKRIAADAQLRAAVHLLQMTR